MIKPVVGSLNSMQNLKRLSGQPFHVGYVSDTRFVLHDVEEEEEEEEEDEVFHLCHHSEKFTIAFGLLSTSLGAPLCISENLQVCGNRHSSTKFIAKIAGRAIITRDAICFHHFEDGHLLFLGLLVMPASSVFSTDGLGFFTLQQA
jgi:hypothetical protein